MYPNAPRAEWPELPGSSQAAGNDAIATASLGIARLLNHAVSFPCMVLRRQCQVHAFARKLHLTPFTLIPVVTHVITKDGITSLWKGSIGVGVLWSLSQLTEIVIADVFGLPRNIVPHGSSHKFWRHIWLKASTFLVMTPFIISSFIETVRSGVGAYFGNDVGVFDIIWRGVDRIRYDFFGTKDTGRKFSVLYLSLPSVSYFTMHYLITKWAYDCIFGMARRYVSRKSANERTRFHAVMPEMFATMTSPLVADLLLYPFETVLHRLYIQGTRTLIDNLDNGVSATNVTMKYNGITDCFQSIVKHEGFSALYSGVGALLLQGALQLGVIWTLRSLLNYSSKKTLQATADLSNGPSPNVLAGPPSTQFAAATAADQAQQQQQATTSTGTNTFTSPSRSGFNFPTFAQSQQIKATPAPKFFGGASPPKFPDSLLLQPTNRSDQN